MAVPAGELEKHEKPYRGWSTNEMIRTGLPPKAALALRRLLEGNEQYRRGNRNLQGPRKFEQGRPHNQTMDPYAVVITCSNPPVPLENIFSVEIGELFVLSISGNTVSPMELSSVEHALAILGPSLVLILGFSEEYRDQGIPDQHAQQNSPAEEKRICQLKSVKNSMMILNKSALFTRMRKAGVAALVGGLYNKETGQVAIHYYDV